MPADLAIVRVLAALSLLTWLYLLLARGGFWRIAPAVANPPVPSPSPPCAPSRRVVAIIPARDEAASIADTVISLLQQSHAGALHVIVIDDGSTDGTAAIATQAAASVGAEARLTVLSGAALRAGWTGKLWAMSQGVAAATTLNPDYLLFTDADIHHQPHNLAALVAMAESQHRDLVSYMVQLPVQSRAEKWLIPAFVFFFFQLYPPSWIASARSRVAAAAGGCMLMRPRALERIGGLEAIREQLIDDCALARATKAAGGSVWLGLTHTARSTRSYGSLREIERMIARSAFNQLHHSYALLMATLLGLGITYVLPPLLLLTVDRLTIVLAAAAWLTMSVCYAPMLRFYRLSPLWCLSLPAIALLYGAATLHSAALYALRRGGHWKGRIQDRHD